MKSIKVVIADDDRLVLEDLRSMVNWHQLGYEIVATAESGEKTLDCLEKWHPDLLITDIIMMGMNGLDVIEKAREKYPKMKYLIISSHDDFAYAKRAISNDVADYILKTEINTASLTQILSKIKDSFSQKQEPSLLTQNELEQFFNHSEDNVSPEKYPMIRHLAQIKYLFMVISPIRLFSRISVDGRTTSLGDIKKIIYDTVLDFCAFPVVCDISDSILVGISMEGTLASAKTARRNAGHTLKYRLNEGTFQFVQFFSEKPQMLSSFRHYFWKIYPVMQYYQFFSYANQMIDMEELEQKHYVPTQQTFSFHSLVFDEEHLENDILGIKKYISLCDNNYDIRTLVSFYQNFCSHLEIRSNNQLKLPDSLSAQTVEYFQKWIYNQLFECIQILSHGLRYEYSPVVDKAIAFMQGNYGDADLTAVEIAAHVGLSANRLGVLFKKETGKTVNEYLNQVRVENAIIFLEKTNMKIYEIAEKCGYRSSQYFSQIIAQRTGKRPIDFRKVTK